MSDEPHPTPLGRRLKEQRRVRGWSQADVAERAKIATGMVSLLETGKRGKRIGRDAVLRIAKAFNEPEQWWLDLAGLGSDADVVNFRPDFGDYIDSDPYLTAEQKLSLKTAYTSFTTQRRRGRRRSDE